MKKLITKLITVVIAIAVLFTLAMSVTGETTAKKAPKLSKTKVTLTIKDKNKNPAVHLKVKNADVRNVKWHTSDFR